MITALAMMLDLAIAMIDEESDQGDRI